MQSRKADPLPKHNESPNLHEPVIQDHVPGGGGGFQRKIDNPVAKIQPKLFLSLSMNRRILIRRCTRSRMKPSQSGLFELPTIAVCDGSKRGNSILRESHDVLEQAQYRLAGWSGCCNGYMRYTLHTLRAVCGKCLRFPTLTFLPCIFVHRNPADIEKLC